MSIPSCKVGVATVGERGVGIPVAADTGYSCDHFNSQILRYKVFSDLWRRGYYLTPGLKYGGDYLVYAGLFEREERKSCV